MSISFFHFNILLLLGIALFGGLVGGRLFQKLRIPQVVGYIIIGIVIGQSGIHIVSENVIKALRPFNYFALGLIGFLVGGELKKEIFSKYGKQLISILLWEGISPFLFVSLGTGIIGSLLFGPSPVTWALAILLGAVASATDPATTTSVLKEYKTRGPLTATILGIVALDDGLALLLFALASSTAGVLIGHGDALSLVSILRPLYEIAGAVIIGILSGLVLIKVLKKYGEKERMLVFSIGTVLFVTGFSLASNVSMLIAVMTLGVMIANFIPEKSKEAFGLVEGFAPPIYVLFFVLVGAKLKFNHMTFPVLFLVFSYLIFGMLGKALGAMIGTRLSGATYTVRKYLPFSLFSQAGVAIGLSILAAQHFPGQVGNTIIVIITATTFVTQLIGPPFTKLAVNKAGEAGLNITEDDIIEKTKVRDFMDKNPPLIYENMQLTEILKIFSQNDNLYYPMMDKGKNLKGIITVEGIKQTFLETEMAGLILADDLKERVTASVSEDTSLIEARSQFNRYNTEYLPVVEDDNKLKGFIERKKMNKFISTKVLELQKQVDLLGG